jgi:hypothetical protein
MVAAEPTPTPDPYALFSQTRSAVSAARYPNRIDYTIEVSGYDGSAAKTNHYQAIDRVDQRSLKVGAISAEEKAAPPIPQGVNVRFVLGICFGGCGGLVIPMGRPVASQDLLGVPFLSPAYAFGMQYPLTRRSTSLPDAEVSGLPVIAVVATQKRDYAIDFVDDEAIDDTPVYHLRFTPLRNPKNNRLRELWAGIGDHLPRKAVVAGNFTIAPLVDVPWTIDFSVIDGAPYIQRERADAVLYMSHRQVVRGAQIAFDDIHEGAGFMGVPLIQSDATDTALEEPDPQ